MNKYNKRKEKKKGVTQRVNRKKKFVDSGPGTSHYNSGKFIDKPLEGT